MASTQESAQPLETTGTLSYTHPRSSDRRMSARQRQMFVTQMTPWAAGHPSIPFEVILEDTSDTGAGVIGERPAKIGMRHLLMVPRAEGEKSVLHEYNVVRCDLRADGKYSIGLELIVTAATPDGTGDADDSATSMPRVSNGSQLKLILLAFALVCLLVALFMPL
jgi:hypothetical protein